MKEFNKITKKYDAVRRCPDRGFECDRMAKERLKHFVSKEAFNIDGLGKKIIEDFWTKKLIKFPQDIFSLDYDKIKALDGWGNLSVSNLKFSIESKKEIDFHKFIYSLGIRHIGMESAKAIATHIKTPSNFFRLREGKFFNDLLNIDGIGQTQIDSLITFFKNNINLKILSELEKALKIKNILTNKKIGKLINKTFLITGKLSGMSRSEVKSLIETNSGKILSNVNKKLNYLIIGDKPTNKKVNLARELSINIINQDDLKKMLD